MSVGAAALPARESKHWNSELCDFDFEARTVDEVSAVGQDKQFGESDAKGGERDEAKMTRAKQLESDTAPRAG